MHGKRNHHTPRQRTEAPDGGRTTPQLNENSRRENPRGGDKFVVRSGGYTPESRNIQASRLNPGARIVMPC
jgi:hypothetical protein